MLALLRETPYTRIRIAFLMYKKTTQQITVSVQPMYLDDQSEPEAAHYVWAYHVRIENHGDKAIRVCHRHWRITDAWGREQNVRGVGVVGEQPMIPPGGCFEYASGAPLQTPSGIMVGSYGIIDAEGQMYEIDIPAFSLDSPFQPVQVH
jgi:ApaG protein